MAYPFTAEDFDFSDTNATNTLDHVKITLLPGTGEGRLSFDGTEITSVSPPQQVTPDDLDDGKLTYAPPENANGSGLATFKFKVNDGTADSDEEYTITIDVTAVNDAGPTSDDKTVTTNEDVAYIFETTDFAFSDFDTNDELDHVTITSPLAADTGTLSFDGTEIISVNPPQQVTPADLGAGKLTYTPPDDANGPGVATFKFKVNDGTVDSDEEYTITIDVTAVNDTPVAQDDTAMTNKGTAVVMAVLANDTDVDTGTTLMVSEVGTPTAPSNGTVAIAADGTTVTYSPTSADFIGEDTFSYTVSDGTATATATVTVTVTPNADLSGLTLTGVTLNALTGVTLNESFAAATTEYTASVAHSVSRVTLTPTRADAGATMTVTVDGTAVTSENGSFDITLAGEETTITVAVTNGTHTKTYTITIFRRRALDRTRPRVTITSAAVAPVTGAFAVTIRFSESVSGFSLTEIDVRNGTASHFKRRSSRTYTATITPEASGAVRVEVGANVARDRAGNGNRPAEPFVIAAALEAAALQGRFESPADGGTVSGIDLIRGWTFAEAAGVGIAEVVLYIDGQRETTIPCCSVREDVQAAYPDFPAANTAASGWGLTYNWGTLAAGAHRLRVVATSSQGVTWESAAHTIHVLKPGEVAFADRFSLATAAVWLEEERLVLDGVVIRDKASQQEQEIEAHYGWRTAAQGLRLLETAPLETASLETGRAGVAWLLAELAAWGRWLLSPARVTAAAGITAAYEAPADQAVVAGIGLIRGWAFAAGSELATVTLRIDGAANGPVPCCSERGDVAAAYPEEGGALDSGWGLVFNYGNLSAGAHTIGVRIATEAGGAETAEHAVTVVQLGGYAFVDAFDVSGAAAWIAGEEIMLSGVEVRDKVTQATQLVNVRLRWSPAAQGLTIVGSEPVP